MTQRNIRLLLASAQITELVQKCLRIQIIADDLTVCCDIHHVKRMDAILSIHVHALISILQNEDDACGCIVCGAHNRMQSIRRMLDDIAMRLHVLKQIEAELVEPQIHDGDTTGHIFDIDNFLHEFLELFLAVFQVTLLLRIDQIIVTGGCHNCNLHARFDTRLKIDILVQIHVRPEIYKLDHFVVAADTINSPEPLDDADRVPMDVVVDQIIAVLQVLALGNTVGGNQHIDLRRIVRKQNVFAFRDGREARQNGIQICPQLRDRRLPIHRAGDHRRVEPKFFLHEPTDICIQIIRRIGERREDDNFPIAWIYRILLLVPNQAEQLLQLGIVRGRDVLYHQRQQLERFGVVLQVLSPRHIIHIGKIDLDFLSDGEIVSVLIVLVEVIRIGEVHHVQDLLPRLVGVDHLDRVIDQSTDSIERQTERINRAFQALQQVDAHQAPNALLTATLRQSFTMGQFTILVQAGFINEERRRVDGKLQ